MKILFVASEATPFIKTGGLADVVGSLAQSLRGRRQACRVVLPLYGDINQEMRQNMKFLTSFYLSLGWRNQYCGVFECSYEGVKYYFLDNEYYFNRSGIYGFYDDAERYAFFSKAALEMLNHIDFEPEIIHCHDWQTAPVPLYLNIFYRQISKYRDIKTVFTIHNIQYQGVFDKKVAFDVMGLSSPHLGIVEYNNALNYIKGAIEMSDAITTVSKSYAEEILDPYFAHGLDYLLREKQYKLSGILNGLDYKEYNSETDTKIIVNYSAKDLDGKSLNKKELQSSLGLKVDADAMIIGVVSRLVSHKGLDLLQYAFNNIMQKPVQFVLLGAGDWQYEKFFREQQIHYPDRVSVTLGYDDFLAHKIYSGADVFLMPSKSEPCGLAQLIALRYGTIPIVRSTGGLKDTIIDVGDEDGYGYTFQSFNADDMLWAITRAVEDFADKALWEKYMVKAMKCDFGWGKSSNAYIELYKTILQL